MTFWRTYYHIVWATKERRPLISPEVEKFLAAHLQRKAENLGVRIFALNGWVDHIHIVVSIPPALSVAEVVKSLKGSSSHDWNLLHKDEDQFTWQVGYGVFSLGERQRSFAEDYVNNQKIHHQNQTTNTWLERVSKDDEDWRGVREEAGVYAVEEMPF